MCPASIVFCSVEWNRWPLHYTDKHSPLPFFLPNAQGTPDQLDIALAIRDQSMLNAAYSAPRHFRKMRNELTERFPAVPLPTARQVPVAILKERQVHGQESQVSRDPSVESDSHPEEDFSWSDAPWQKRKNPPGLSRSLCSKLYQASRQTAESLKIALQMITENHGAHDEDDSFRDVDSLGDEEGARYSTVRRSPMTLWYSAAKSPGAYLRLHRSFFMEHFSTFLSCEPTNPKRRDGQTRTLAWTTNLVSQHESRILLPKFESAALEVEFFPSFKRKRFMVVTELWNLSLIQHYRWFVWSIHSFWLEFRIMGVRLLI